MNERDPRESEPVRRIAIEAIQIDTAAGKISLGKRKLIELYEHGDIVSEELSGMMINEGEAISSLAEIKGQCQNCLKLLSERTFRFCNNCHQVRCPRCSALDTETSVWLCTECMKALVRSRQWAAARRVLFAPFRRG